MFDHGLTPIQVIREGTRQWFAKRDDLAAFTSADMPSGAKVRQYRRMIAAAPDDAVLAVGCSAASAMQVYVAAAGVESWRPAHVAVPKRKKRHPSTRWAADHGAILHEVAPGYPSQYHGAIRALPEQLGRPVVKWDRRLAALDTAEQVRNLPHGLRTIVVPSGSGLTAAGIILGLMDYYDGVPDIAVRAVAMSDMTTRDGILELVAKYDGRSIESWDVRLEVIPATVDYTKPAWVTLPGEDTPLDPWYAAKAVHHVGPDELLWVTGRRPVAAHMY